MLWKIALGIFLAAHGLIHLGYITPAPADPRYPFNLNKSWLITPVGLDEPAIRLLGTVLSVMTVVGFILTGLAAAGIIIPQNWGLPLTIASSIASLLLLLLFWHPWLVLGVTIDIALLVALLWFGWHPFGLAGA